MSEIVQAQKKARHIVLSILRNHRDDVDDVLQNAAIYAIRNEKQFRGDSRFSTWFVRIAIRSALMHLRSKEMKYLGDSLSIEVNNFDTPSLGENPEEFAIRNEREAKMYDRVHKELKKLTMIRYKAIVRLMYGDKLLNNAEKSARFQGKKQLRKLLGAIE